MYTNRLIDPVTGQKIQFVTTRDNHTGMTQVAELDRGPNPTYLIADLDFIDQMDGATEVRTTYHVKSTVGDQVKTLSRIHNHGSFEFFIENLLLDFEAAL